MGIQYGKADRLTSEPEGANEKTRSGDLIQDRRFFIPLNRRDLQTPRRLHYKRDLSVSAALLLFCVQFYRSRTKHRCMALYLPHRRVSGIAGIEGTPVMPENNDGREKENERKTLNFVSVRLPSRCCADVRLIRCPPRRRTDIHLISRPTGCRADIHNSTVDLIQ